jgi:hypothetical protein
MSSVGSDESSNPKAELDREKLRQDKLLKVYEAALAEYRFNVQLAWDRTKFILGLCVTALAALAGFFALVIGVALIGRDLSRSGKVRYRHAIHSKLVIEHQLGLLELTTIAGRDVTLEIAGRPGVVDVGKALNRNSEKGGRGSDPGSATSRMEWIYILIIVIASVAIIVCAQQIWRISSAAS